ncbi:hypothetical protein [Frigidibacter sp. ROC022]|uniref:hypothetical protein n=1 Tax=Frigidibacter sp. ROC022 TaxID=2971796 RepID=UPI00215A759B|nr:hypothetical protein [Frigidibacter sp. ROC022]MCR8722781.1 hypothetical protein [Frigidibacter sp. ROC022]
MPRLRSVILTVMPPRWRAEAQRESRQWMATCRSCGHEQSIWDHGGLRWKSAGQPGMLLVCPDCRGKRNHRIWRDPSAA